MVASYKIRTILSPAQLAAAQDEPSFHQPAVAMRSERARGERPRPAPAVMEEDVTESVRTIERAVENLAALTENCEYFKTMADDLRDGLEAEKAERKAAKRHLAELEHEMRTERERMTRAEENAAGCDLTIKNLQRELDAMRAQTERLVGVVGSLIPADRVPDLRDAFDRLVA